VTGSGTSWTRGSGGDLVPNTILRIRNLKTNFYTYAGVVKALDGVSFDLFEGETLGLVGETGCGKSVTALSVLRLIPQPPGKIEEGEVLFDVPEDVAKRIDALEAQVYALLSRIFGNAPEGRPPDLSPTRLGTLWRSAQRRATKGSPDIEALRAAIAALQELKAPYDLVTKSDEDLRAIRGNRIAMIFQEPMQALNPVFPIGDQIAENIVLHQKQAVVRSLVDKMELEVERDAIGKTLRSLARGGAAAGRSLAPPARRPTWVVAVALLWLAWSVVSAGLFSLLSLDVALVGLGGPSASFGFVFVLALGSLLASIGILRLHRAVRGPAIILAVVQLLASLILVMGPFPAWFRASIGVGMVVDLIVLYLITRSGAAEAFVGRHGGFEGALVRAEGDPNQLLDVRDLVAASSVREDARESTVSRLDRFIERANRTLSTDEPITGHLNRYLPRGFQISYYKRARDVPRSLYVRVLPRLPLFGRLIARPLSEEGVRWSVDMLRRVKISDPERIATQYPYELSGGMQQRALIAIALSCNPRLLIADEPTTALDVTIQAQILDLIRELKKDFGSTVLLITHDLGIIAEMCNRVCVMYAGIIAEDAPVRTLFKAPLHPYTQGLLKAVPSHTVRKEELEIIRGSVPNLIYPPPGCRFHPRCPLVMPTCGWSPAEVGDRLRALLTAQAAREKWPFDIERLSWTPEGNTKLRIGVPAGVSPEDAMDRIRKALATAEPDPALRAITSIQLVPVAGKKAAGSADRDVLVAILRPEKPPAFQVAPDHRVACLLYEAPMPTPVVGGGRRG